MQQWVRFFLGTPRRFLTTLGFLCLIGVLVEPGLLGKACTRLMIEIQPVLGPALQLGIIVAIVVFMLKAALRGK